MNVTENQHKMWNYKRHKVISAAEKKLRIKTSSEHCFTLFQYYYQ